MTAAPCRSSVTVTSPGTVRPCLQIGHRMSRILPHSSVVVSLRHRLRFTTHRYHSEPNRNNFRFADGARTPGPHSFSPKNPTPPTTQLRQPSHPSPLISHQNFTQTTRFHSTKTT